MAIPDDQPSFRTLRGFLAGVEPDEENYFRRVALVGGLSGCHWSYSTSVLMIWPDHWSSTTSGTRIEGRPPPHELPEDV